MQNVRLSGPRKPLFQESDPHIKHKKFISEIPTSYQRPGQVRYSPWTQKVRGSRRLRIKINNILVQDVFKSKIM